MRLRITILIILVTGALQLSAQNSLLKQKVSLKLEKSTLGVLFAQIEQEYGLHFSYNPDILPKDPYINIEVSRRPIGKALEPILRLKGLRVVEKNSQLIILPLLPELNLTPPDADAALEKIKDPESEFYEISGMVMHRLSHRPLRDVRVTESKSLTSTKTGSNGTYQLRLKEKPDSLFLRFSLEHFMEERVVLAVDADRYHSTTLMPQPKRLEFIPEASFDEGTRTASIENDLLVRTFISEDVREATKNDSITFTPGIQLSLFPPISTSQLGSGAAINNFSLNIIAGYAEGLCGLEVGGFLNIDKSEVTGLQLAGSANIAGGPVNGLQTAGFLNSVKGEVLGIQASGFMNTSRDENKALQAAGFLNVH